MNPIVQFKVYGVQHGRRHQMFLFETTAHKRVLPHDKPDTAKRIKASMARTHAAFAPVQFSRNRIVSTGKAQS